MGLLGLAVATEVLEKDRKDIRDGKYKNATLYTGFSQFITGNKQAKNPLGCTHNNNPKSWVPMKTLRVRRDGFGSGEKTIIERCRFCGEQRTRHVKFPDIRVEF